MLPFFRRLKGGTLTPKYVSNQINLAFFGRTDIIHRLVRLENIMRSRLLFIKHITAKSDCGIVVPDIDISDCSSGKSNIVHDIVDV